MRKLAMVVGGAMVAAFAALVAFDAPEGGAAAAAAAPVVAALEPQAVQAQTAAPAKATDGSYELTAADSANLKGPKQPILFRHDIHSGQYKIQCQYCHYSVAVSSEPGIPSMQTCMGCHLVIGGQSETNKAQIKLVRQAWAEKKPVEWVRVHYLARHVHFPHSRHVKAMGPNACATCHGDVSRMPQVYKVNNINNMGWCINCHVERKVTRDCSTCHY